jgi:CheY-like chemotaxis protein
MKSILIVEDNPDLRDLFCFVLRNEGYDVQEAENGREALDQLEAMQPPPCLVLLDLMMPIMTGLELLHFLAERNQLADLQVVVLSAGGQPSQVPQAQRFIRKPVDPSLVVQVVREVCGMPNEA